MSSDSNLETISRQRAYFLRDALHQPPYVDDSFTDGRWRMDDGGQEEVDDNMVGRAPKVNQHRNKQMLPFSWFSNSHGAVHEPPLMPEMKSVEQRSQHVSRCFLGCRIYWLQMEPQSWTICRFHVAFLWVTRAPLQQVSRYLCDPFRSHPRSEEC